MIVLSESSQVLLCLVATVTRQSRSVLHPVLSGVNRFLFGAETVGFRKPAAVP
jgi:hypothetical protein